ncbi:Ca2+-dependent phosphoinositide-specific phospholipase C [Sphingomonas sp.]|uniref:Ca2+-dependent phosphoinositide-specific phospholipase C n=1 Tax=Sphingomonas sp. TaxID=28214 RepID=UPI00183036B8|nr:Ca2+-dependent phosphoinositide-specific phospholipase C [Sphingomonas sp.]MBA4761130.1 hypothetical protein [Sphingomonas sp.]
MMKALLTFSMASLLTPAVAPRPEHADLGNLRLDQVQYIQTHNSYHLAPDPTMVLYLLSSGYRDGPDWSGPRLARATAYSNLPLETQLELGIRAFELDVYDDPQGGRFAEPAIFRALAERKLPPAAAWDPDGAMKRPGFKTIHKEHYDPRSTCPVFKDCLREIAQWSARHPDHVPIYVMIETKGGPSDAACAGLCVDGWARLEGEITAIIPRDAILRPVDIVSAWPMIDAARGKILFFLLDEDDAAESYRNAAATKGLSLLFTGERPAKKAALPTRRARWAILPKPGDARMADAIRAGMLSYTRADSNTEAARTADSSDRDRAFASGASIISTDFPIPDRRYSNYAVRFPNGAYIRCNPTTAKELCSRP